MRAFVCSGPPGVGSRAAEHRQRAVLRPQLGRHLWFSLQRPAAVPPQPRQGGNHRGETRRLYKVFFLSRSLQMRANSHVNCSVRVWLFWAVAIWRLYENHSEIFCRQSTNSECWRGTNKILSRLRIKKENGWLKEKMAHRVLQCHIHIYRNDKWILWNDH